LIEKIENAILGLDTMPHRCPMRKIGVYANKGYRQLFVGNYTVIFRIDEERRYVLVVTVKYSFSQF
jgi:mRNA-degrading endonuclease RelE of RelBE toxin-antitoxin system